MVASRWDQVTRRQRFGLREDLITATVVFASLLALLLLLLS
jgi:hypothetical protein